MKKLIPQGHDVPIDFTLKSSDGSILQPNSLLGILVIIYYSVSGQILSKFSINELAGYSDILVLDNAAGKIRVIVPASVTKTAKTGALVAEIKVKVTDAEGEDGNIEMGLNDLYCFDLTESRLKDVSGY